MSTQILSGVRFAPSPTGRFHVGNLRSAFIASALSKTLSQPLIIRMEDIDAPRVVQGAALQQIRDMHEIGVKGDAVFYQSENIDRHFLFFMEAFKQSQIYPCDCSRKEVQAELAGLASAPHAPYSIYTGRCRSRDPNEILSTSRAESIAWRFKMKNESGHEDFVIARTPPKSVDILPVGSFVPAYHWACAIDDHIGGYAVLVRAWDLESSIPLQRAIQSWLCTLESTTNIWPSIFHTALVLQNDGHRLEKRTPNVTLPELAKRGLYAHELKVILERSISRQALEIKPVSGGIYGETQRTMTLADLNLSPA